jgi:hypothetical protein
MEKTWAKGAVELLRHADSHIDLSSAFDKRIAFVSIDNCVETCVRTFLGLPATKSGVKVPHADLEAAANSFPRLVDLLFKHAASRLSGVDPGDVEHYHRIRNRLYHEGTGLSVDDQYLAAYRSIAVLFLESLFGVTYAQGPAKETRLDTLIVNFNRIERILRERMRRAGTDDRHTFKWEQAFQAGAVDPALLPALTELRMARNRLAHSTEIDPDDVAFWVKKSKSLLAALETSERDG